MIFDTGGRLPNKTTLLWTNENPNEPFEEQTLDLDISEYKFLYITVTDVYNSGTCIIVNDPLIPKHKAYIHSAANSDNKYRDISIVENKLVFGNGAAIPLYIYGAFNEM